MDQDHAHTSMFELVERDAWLDLFASVPDDCARKLGIGSQRLRDMGVLASREVPIVEFNRAMCIGMVAPATRADLDAASEWLQANAAPGWAMQVGPDARTAMVEDWLQRHATTASGTGWAKFQRKATPDIQTSTSAVDIRLVNAGSADAFGAVVQAGFDLPAETANWFAALCGRPGWTLYLAYAGETPVASAAAFASQDVAWFGIDATLADYRQRGAQTALIHRRIADGHNAGLAGFTAETGQPTTGQEAAHTSYSNYLRAGFTPAYARANYKRTS
jgi:hypothetical protein